MCLLGLNALSFDPAANNDPLQFNGSSGPVGPECPPLETASENSKKRKRASLPPGTNSTSCIQRTLSYMFWPQTFLFSNTSYRRLCSSCAMLIISYGSKCVMVFFFFFPGRFVFVDWPAVARGSCLSCRGFRQLRQEPAQLSVSMLTTPAHQNH